MPLLVRDEVKVRLLDVYGWKDREASMHAGTASFRVMDYVIEEQIKHGNSLIVEGTFNPTYDDARFQAWQETYGVQYSQVYCYAEAGVIRQRFTERAALDGHHVSCIEAAEGLQNLEDYIVQGKRPLNVGGPVVMVDTTDFAMVDEDAVVRGMGG
jgi:hypothetical protein